MDGSNFIFTCVIIKEEAGYSSLCLELDIASEGDTLQEAKSNLREAVQLYLETAIESNLPIIRPVPQGENPLITQPQSVMKVYKMKVNLKVRILA